MTHLRQAMLEELQRRNYAKTTVETYIHAVEQFAKHFKRSPDRLTHDHLRTYQAYLLRERKLGPRTVRLHVAALRFFFVKTLRRRYLLDDTPYPKVPRRLPAILTVDEVTRLIDAARNLTDRAMLMVLYSTGMRNAELRHLQVRDIDSRRMLIHIQHGKGGRDRYVRSARRCSRRCACTTAGCAFRVFLQRLFRHDWVVYAKPPFGGPTHVLHYLARYTHRVAISNHRIVNVAEDHVTFRWKDYAHGSATRTMTVSADEFLRRFFLHVLPKGFVRIRFFGFLASRRRAHDLPRCRQALASRSSQAIATPTVETATPSTSWPCPRCGGTMMVIERLTMYQIGSRALAVGIFFDTS